MREKELIKDINNMLANINCSPELFHDGIDIEIKDLLYEIKSYFNKDVNTDVKLDNLINMIKEFDYKKNGKQASLQFILMMYQYFYEIDF